RRRQQLAALAHEEPLLVQRLGRRQYLACQTHDTARLNILVIVVVTAEEQAYAGDNQEAAENELHPAEAMDQGRAADDQRGEQHDGPQNAPDEPPVLVLAWNTEAAEHEHDDEDVVDRERLLEQVAGHELEGVLLPEPPVDEAGEQRRQADPDA